MGHKEAFCRSEDAGACGDGLGSRGSGGFLQLAALAKFIHTFV
jgi:hypothetical protein